MTDHASGHGRPLNKLTLVLFLVVMCSVCWGGKSPDIHFECDDNAASTAVVDSIAADNGAFTVDTNTITAADRLGVANNALSPDSATVTENRITLGTTYDFTSDTDGSAVSVWLKSADYTAEFLLGEDLTNALGFVSTTLVRCSLGGSNTDITLSEAAVVDTWTMWTAVYGSNDTLTIYKNGISVGSGTPDDSVNQLNATVIGSNLSAKSGWIVTYDDIKLLDEALTANEVEDLYNSDPYVAEQEVVFTVIADVHASLDERGIQGPGDSPGYRVEGYEENSLTRAVSSAAYSGSSFFVSNGDLVQGVFTTDTIADEYTEYKTGVTSLAIPHYFTIGHHDVGSTSIDADDYTALFADPAGLGPILATGADAPANAWWPTTVTDDTAVSYTIDETVNGVTFRFIFLSPDETTSEAMSNPGETDAFGGDAESKTLLEWFTQMLSEAEATNWPVCVFTHYPLITGGLSTLDGYGDAQDLLEAQTIFPIVLMGHSHNKDSTTILNDVTYVFLKADTWGDAADDTDRYAHAVVTLTYPVYKDDTDRWQMNYRIDGYGNQSSSAGSYQTTTSGGPKDRLSGRL